MSPEDMASDEKRQQNAKIRQEVAADLVRGQQQAASTDMFQCVMTVCFGLVWGGMLHELGS